MRLPISHANGPPFESARPPGQVETTWEGNTEPLDPNRTGNGQFVESASNGHRRRCGSAFRHSAQARTRSVAVKVAFNRWAETELISAARYLETERRLTEHWIGRFVFDRVTSNYNRDSDIFLVGLGYSWR